MIMDRGDLQYIAQDPSGSVIAYSNKPKFEEKSNQWVYDNVIDTGIDWNHIILGVAPLRNDHKTFTLHMLKEFKYADVIKEAFKGIKSTLDLC